MICEHCGRTVASNVSRVMRCGCGHDMQVIGSGSSRATTEPSFVAKRRAICRACEHSDGVSCLVLVKQGKGAVIEGKKGIHSATAKCPLAKWRKND